MKKYLIISSLLFSSLIFGQISTGEINFTPGFTGEVTIDDTNVTLTLAGDENRYLAVGFGVSTMTFGEDIVSFDSTGFNDRQFLGIGVTPTTDTQDWTVVSNTTSGGVRTIIVTRPLAGSDSSDFTFNPSATSLQMVWARGSNLNFVNHGGDRGATLVNFVLGVDGVVVPKTINLYPFPATEVLNVNLLNFNIEAAVIKFVNTTGQVVYENEVTQLNSIINVENLASGFYILSLTTQEGTFTSRFMKR